MRQLKPDVSHRIRRRPSIFRALWFRLMLGSGVAAIVALVVGPPVAGWLSGSSGRPPIATIPAGPPPDAAFPGSPASVPPAARPGRAADGADAAPQVSRPRPGRAGRDGSGAAADPRRMPAAVGPETAGSPGPAPTPAAGETPAGAGAVKGAAPAGDARQAAEAGTRPAAVSVAAGGRPAYHVQVGAFRDPRNADRLAARLRAAGFEVAEEATAEARARYRLRVTPGSGGAADAVGRLAELGLEAEPVEDGTLRTRPIPLAAAVAASRELRERGVAVRVERDSAAGGLRLVRVGPYASVAEAERVRAGLAAQGIQGIVVPGR